MTNTDLRKTLAQNIKTYRKLLNLTQENLAESVNLSVQMIADIESCRTWISDKTLVKIAESLNTTVSKLFSENQAEHEEIDILQIKTSLERDITHRIGVAFHQIASATIPLP